MRRFIRFFDWTSFFIVITLSLIGLIFVFSATYIPEIPFSIFFKKQAFGIASGILIYLLFSAMDYRIIAGWGYLAYISVMGLLIFTVIKGSIGMGAKRWINLFVFKGQPSELAKLFLPPFLAHYFQTQKEDNFYKFKDFIPILIVLLFTSLLILKQPDLGTTIIYLFTAGILLWLIGIGKKFFIISFAFLLISAPISWKLLKPYQKKRITVFLGEGDARKERYQIEQSKIAIGSGGLEGKGFLKGTQNKLLFLPESRTDFIFSVICEELGFIGAMLIIALYMALFLGILRKIQRIKNFFGQTLATGLILHVLISTMVNIAMTLGLLPTVGIPLPFISYGISHLWITFASLGWINGIMIREL